MSSLCSGLYLRFVWHLARRFGILGLYQYSSKLTEIQEASDTGFSRVAHLTGAVLRNGKYSFNLLKNPWKKIGDM